VVLASSHFSHSSFIVYLSARTYYSSSDLPLLGR
jgi:hypothetical protein